MEDYNIVLSKTLADSFVWRWSLNQRVPYLL